MTLYPPQRLIDTTLVLPLSKSMTLRAMVIEKMRSGDIEKLPVPCRDAEILKKGLLKTHGVIDCELSGAAARFLIAYHAVKGNRVIVDGSPRLRQRPVNELVTALQQAGFNLTSTDGHLPIKIDKHHLSRMPERIEIDCSRSSQYASALIMALPGTEIIPINLIGSAPYITMTRQMMKQEKLTIEPDAGASAPWKLLEMITGHEIKLSPIPVDSLQPDSTLFEILTELELPSRYEHDFSSHPDLVPYVALMCCVKRKPFRFTGLHNLKYKESDRMMTTQEMCACFGYTISINQDAMTYDGNCIPVSRPPVIDPRDDHRIALASAPMAALYPGMKILNPDCVEKSYPIFWDHMHQLGFQFQQ